MKMTTTFTPWLYKSYQRMVVNRLNYLKKRKRSAFRTCHLYRCNPPCPESARIAKILYGRKNARIHTPNTT